MSRFACLWLAAGVLAACQPAKISGGSSGGSGGGSGGTTGPGAGSGGAPATGGGPGPGAARRRPGQRPSTSAPHHHLRDRRAPGREGAAGPAAAGRHLRLDERAERHAVEVAADPAGAALVRRRPGVAGPGRGAAVLPAAAAPGADHLPAGQRVHGGVRHRPPPVPQERLVLRPRAAAADQPPLRSRYRDPVQLSGGHAVPAAGAVPGRGHLRRGLALRRGWRLPGEGRQLLPERRRLQPDRIQPADGRDRSPARPGRGAGHRPGDARARRPDPDDRGRRRRPDRPGRACDQPSRPARRPGAGHRRPAHRVWQHRDRRQRGEPPAAGGPRHPDLRRGGVRHGRGGHGAACPRPFRRRGRHAHPVHPHHRQTTWASACWRR